MGTSRPSRVGLTIYCARAGDHNDLAMAGAVSVGMALAKRLGIPPATIGKPETALNSGWRAELEAAKPALSDLAEHIDGLFGSGRVPLSALSRCAASLATLPVVMRHRPGVCVVWLDAHPDLNTPVTTTSGYLGGMALAGPAGLWDSGLGNGLAPASIILVGTRDLDPAEQTLVESGMVKLIPRRGDYLAQLRDAVAGRPVYIHLDCDVLEPGIVPTDYRVPGGFTLTELNAICKELARSELAGLEIAEFENAWTAGGVPVSPDPMLDALDPVIPRLDTGR